MITEKSLLSNGFLREFYKLLPAHRVGLGKGKNPCFILSWRTRQKEGLRGGIAARLRSEANNQKPPQVFRKAVFGCWAIRNFGATRSRCLIFRYRRLYRLFLREQCPRYCRLRRLPKCRICRRDKSIPTSCNQNQWS